MSDPAASSRADGSRPWLLFSRRERIQLTIALFFVSFCSFMDRFFIGILQEPIRAEFNLTDTQWGLMAGFAFAVFYATLGIPVARWADRGNRRLIITASFVAWSAMTALCGLAQNFAQLLLARLGVGVGEAGTTPPSHSLVGDYFPPEGRSTALAAITFGSSSGVAIGVIAGGYIAAEYGWRMTFIALGVPGILLALLVALLFEEPRKRPGFIHGGAAASRESLRRTIGALRAKPSYVQIVIAFTLYQFVVGGAIVFIPGHFMRALHMPIEKVGLYYGLATAIAAGVGAFFGGRLADVMSRRDPRWMVRFPTIAMAAVFPLFIGFALANDYVVALAFYLVAWMILTMGYPPIFAAVQAVVGSTRRATAVALMLLVGTLIGSGIGPVVTGAISDALAPRYAENSLRYAFMVVFVVLLWSSAHFWRVGRTFLQDMEDRVDATPPSFRA